MWIPHFRLSAAAPFLHRCTGALRSACSKHCDFKGLLIVHEHAHPKVRWMQYRHLEINFNIFHFIFESYGPQIIKHRGHIEYSEGKYVDICRQDVQSYTTLLTSLDGQCSQNGLRPSHRTDGHWHDRAANWWLKTLPGALTYRDVHGVVMAKLNNY